LHSISKFSPLLQFQHKEYEWLFAGLAILLLFFYIHLQWKQKVKKRMGMKG
jgi:hypothetical protein